MVNDTKFTDTVNYGRLGNLLRSLGHTTVPEDEVIKALVVVTKDPQLIEWTMAQINSPHFTSLVAFNMTQASDG
ncbi:MAG: hypothetical protein JWL82_308 [Parcubacteria group bacterium]|nr:hypothetical protein [Parcubacteria group bacterium]